MKLALTYEQPRVFGRACFLLDWDWMARDCPANSGLPTLVRLLLTLLPVVVLFVLWDLYAIASGHWTFDETSTTGILLPGGLPLDELLFFFVIPICAILTLEAVRSVKGWPVGDEAPATSDVR